MNRLPKIEIYYIKDSIKAVVNMLAMDPDKHRWLIPRLEELLIELDDQRARLSNDMLMSLNGKGKREDLENG